MPATDTSEQGLESLVVESLVSESGYQQGCPEDYDRDHAVDLAKLLAFLQATQPKAVETLGLAEEGPQRQQFLHRLQGEITKRGVIDVLTQRHQAWASLCRFVLRHALARQPEGSGAIPSQHFQHHAAASLQ